jgi:hypothetical protein
VLAFAQAQSGSAPSNEFQEARAVHPDCLHCPSATALIFSAIRYKGVKDRLRAYDPGLDEERSLQLCRVIFILLLMRVVPRRRRRSTHYKQS